MGENSQSQTTLEKHDDSDERGVQESGNGECSRSLEVYFGDYPMIKMEEFSGFPLSFDVGNSNPPNDGDINRILGQEVITRLQNNGHKDKTFLSLELIERLQHRTRGLRRLTRIHGVDLTNQTEDRCPRRSTKKEILEEVLGISHPMVSQSEKVVAHDEENDVNVLEKEPRAGARKTRSASRKLNTGKKTVLSWMIETGTIPQREKVHYMDHKNERALLSGDIFGDGILCDCCFQVVSISQFEAHSRRQIISDDTVLENMSEESNPLKNMFEERRGRSLLQCMEEAWNRQDKFSVGKFYNEVRVRGSDHNDVTCSLCGKRGDLICCDSCPSTFHQSCLDIQTLPSGDWNCMYCCCKFCGFYKQTESFQLFSCRLCEQRYHQSCLEATGANTSHSTQSSLCGHGCKELYERLEKLLRVKHNIEDGFSWSFICRSDVDSNVSHIEPRVVECNAKIAVALSVMYEGFRPCIDDGSEINLIHSVMYNCGSNFPRLDCKRFITAILERGDEITSVASIRIHGNQLAEMPFVTTRSVYRHGGMFNRLLKAIESALSFLNVELLVIPSVKELKEIWIRSFGFEPLDLRSKKMIKGMNLLVFRGTEMLQKKIPKRNFPDENLKSYTSCQTSKRNLDSFLFNSGLPLCP